MSPELHPDWHSEQGEQPVRISVRPTAEQKALPSTVSRKPAAVAGIVMVAGVLISIYGTTDMFSAQVPPAAPSSAAAKNVIRITAAGVVPTTLTVKPGDTVTWKNESEIPHIMTSDTLLTSDGPLETSPIFPESSEAVTIKATLKPGTYTYESKTAAISGTIEVSAGGADAALVPAVVSSVKQQSVSSAPKAVIMSSAAPIEQPVMTSSAKAVPAPAPMFPPLGGQVSGPLVPVVPVAPTGTIPRNPHTVGKPAVAASSVGSQQKTSLHAGAPLKATKPAVTQHKPTKQPESGQGNWIVAMLCFGAFLGLFKHSMGKTAWTAEPRE